MRLWFSASNNISFYLSLSFFVCCCLLFSTATDAAAAADRILSSTYIDIASFLYQFSFFFHYSRLHHLTHHRLKDMLLGFGWVCMYSFFFLFIHDKNLAYFFVLQIIIIIIIITIHLKKNSVKNKKTTTIFLLEYLFITKLNMKIDNIR